MTTLAASSPSTRAALVAEIRARLERETFPRGIVLLLLLLAGGAAFLCSVFALDAGLVSMARRYALAAAGGYLVFLGLIRAWIAVRRGWSPDVNVDAVDAGDVLDLVNGLDAPRRVASSESLADTASYGFDFSLDLDELWWLALAVVAVTAGLVAVGFVVYSAPVLLAEVALDAALVGAVYRKLRREDQRYWATTALRHTWASAAVLVTFVAVLGFALQRFAPNAVSIGDVVRHFLAR
jgi:hypothetical protein